MFITMPWSLILAFIIFTGFVRIHHGHAADNEGHFPGFHSVLIVSTILGYLVGAGLMVFYLVQTTWYWALILLVLTVVGGSALYALIEPLVSLLGLSLITFAGWPITGYWIYDLIRSLHH